jgi:hypothetical protein
MACSTQIRSERCGLDSLVGEHVTVVGGAGVNAREDVTNGAVDRGVHGGIADERSRSTIKNSPAILVRIMEQAVRDGIIDRNPARVTEWQREFQRAEDELDDPRSLAVPTWSAPQELAVP